MLFNTSLLRSRRTRVFLHGLYPTAQAISEDKGEEEPEQMEKFDNPMKAGDG